MGKIHSITAGIIMAGSTLAGIGGQDVVAQTPGNNNNNANIEQVKNNTSKELLGLDQYDYKKMLYMDISLLSAEVVKKVMFERINEIRTSYGLKKLKYNLELDSIALDFAMEKNGTQRRNEKYPHNNKKGRSPYRRVYESRLGKELDPINKNNKIYGVEENLVSANNSVYTQIESLMESPGHKKAILSEYINSIGFGYIEQLDVLVQLFANLK